VSLPRRFTSDDAIAARVFARGDEASRTAAQAVLDALHRDMAAAAAVAHPSPLLLDEVELRHPTGDDCAAFLEASNASIDLHGSWVAPARDPQEFAAYLERFEPDSQVSYLVWWRERLAGVVNLQDIIHSNYLGTTLGYYAFSGSDGRGVMRTAVAKATDIAFEGLGLHRIEAGIQPTNTRSVALVRALGYRLEAYLPRLVRVDGVWRDHELWVTTTEEWPGAAAALGRS